MLDSQCQSFISWLVTVAARSGGFGWWLGVFGQQFLKTLVFESDCQINEAAHRLVCGASYGCLLAGSLWVGWLTLIIYG
ncbi:hypothetical protein, partial [Paraoerskovia marina]|uniref:hypothetical protein n=2 Tax=Paraoerskovia marina TaxID=545619 RepID=UPI001B804114